MSVRKRVWKTAIGESREAYVVDYVDVQRRRRLKTFEKKRDAEVFEKRASVDVVSGTHVADRASITVEKAGELWILVAEANGLERGTIEQYKQHLKLHIKPFIGTLKLSQLNVPKVREFLDTLIANDRSVSMVCKVRVSLGSLIADAQERGRIGHNPVRELKRSSRRRRKMEAKADKLRGRRLQIGVDIPTPDEIRAIVHAATERWRPLLITAIFTGLRASELRGLRWQDVDLKKARLEVRQRADRYNEIGETKSESSDRTLPLYPIVVSTLREWKLKCPKGKLGLVFPNGAGNVESRKNIATRGLQPSLIRAGVTVPVLNLQGEPERDYDSYPVVKAKYAGLHALRHFYASWCINRKQDGGLELPLKNVQTRMGHSSIRMTADVYGHLFKEQEDPAGLAEAERGLLTPRAV